MGKYDIFKNRLSMEEAKGAVLEFCASRKRMYVSLDGGVHILEYFYYEKGHYLLVKRASYCYGNIKLGDRISGLICASEAEREKMYQQLRATFLCKQAEEAVIKGLSGQIPLVKKMMGNGADLFELELVAGKVIWNSMEQFDLDANWNASFAKFAPNGKARYEHSRHVLMSYGEKEVVFTVIVEDGTYYTLTHKNSNKMEYLQQGGTCRIYDGKGYSFSTKMELLPESEVEVVFQKLKDTNNMYFKTTEDLVALAFRDESK